MARVLRATADIVILCMIADVEQKAIRHQLGLMQAREVSRDKVARDEIRFSLKTSACKNELSVILICIGSASNQDAGIKTTAALFRYSPRFVFLCGIAGSMQPLKYPRGTVVAASSIVSRRISKVTDGDNKYLAENPPVAVSTYGQSILRDLMASATTDKMASPILDAPPFKLVHERILSWDIVLDCETEREFLVNHFDRKVAAVEMESAGFYSAIHHYRDNFIRRPGRESGGDVDGIVIRGVSDHAAEKTASDAEPINWRQISAANAAHILQLVMEHLSEDDFAKS